MQAANLIMVNPVIEFFIISWAFHFLILFLKFWTTQKFFIMHIKEYGYYSHLTMCMWKNKSSSNLRDKTLKVNIVYHKCRNTNRDNNVFIKDEDIY